MGWVVQKIEKEESSRVGGGGGETFKERSRGAKREKEKSDNSAKVNVKGGEL